MSASESPRSSDPELQTSAAMLRLLTADGVGPATVQMLVSHFGHPRQVLEASLGQLRQVDGVNPEAASLIHDSIAASNPEKELSRLHSIDARMIAWDELEYPSSLCRIPDPPGVLRIRGGSLKEFGLAVAMVGTRRCSAYGRRQAARFAAALGGAGVTIVSGGARGIDAEIHRACLRAGGRTVAVLGSGLGQLYPPEHADLFDEIVETGGSLISELPVWQPPRPWQFPRRNRIIAGLSVGVLVVEAPRRSGAMITARLAVEEQGRESWAIPGSVEQPSMAGCHAAIAEGWCALVDSPESLLQWLDDHWRLWSDQR
ncbi:MAG: DNA-processing protein DprA [Phycisphaerales bacterium]|nr:DNA-processing protein DprA [Phycisphaerales bacterium]